VITSDDGSDEIELTSFGDGVVGEKPKRTERICLTCGALVPAEQRWLDRHRLWHEDAK
jgi:hypothetical protein